MLLLEIADQPDKGQFRAGLLSVLSNKPGSCFHIPAGNETHGGRAKSAEGGRHTLSFSDNLPSRKS